MEETICEVQTTLPGDWIDAMVGEWCFLLVDKGLTKCVHRSRTASTYSWQGEIVSEREWHIQCKVSPAKKQALIEEIKSVHPYDLPMILVTQAESTAEYADWINRE